MWSSLCLPVAHQDLRRDSTPGVRCSRTLQQGVSNMGLTTKKTEGGERIRFMFKPACEHQGVLDPGLCREWAHSRRLRAVAPPPRYFRWSCSRTARLDTCAALRGRQEEVWRPAVPWCTHPLMFRGTEQWAWLFLHGTSASASYCKPGAVRGPGALSHSNPERVDAESLSQPSLSDHLLLIR